MMGLVENRDYLERGEITSNGTNLEIFRFSSCSSCEVLRTEREFFFGLVKVDDKER